MRHVSLVFLLLAALTTIARAGEKAGITMPDKMEVAGKTLVLNGMGLREATVLDIDVYVAGLYLETKSSDAAQILASKQVMRLVMHFKRDVGRDKIVDAWNEGYLANATVPIRTIQPQINTLVGWMTDVSDGDLLTYTWLPGKGLQVHRGAQLLGLIAGDDFARSTFAVWLGKDPPTKALKRGLLGKDD